MPVSRTNPPEWKRLGFRSKREHIWSTNKGTGALPPTGYTWGPEGLELLPVTVKPLTAEQIHERNRTMRIKRIPLSQPVYLSGDKEFAITPTLMPGRKACLWELEKVEGANTGRAFTLVYFPNLTTARAYVLSIPATEHPPVSDKYRRVWPNTVIDPDEDRFGLVMPGTGPWQVAAFDWIRDDPKYPQYRHRFAHLDPMKYRSDLSKKIFPEGEPEAGYRHAL